LVFLGRFLDLDSSLISLTRPSTYPFLAFGCRPPFRSLCVSAPRAYTFFMS
jgi:hypothetical protein